MNVPLEAGSTNIKQNAGIQFLTIAATAAATKPLLLKSVSTWGRAV